MTKLISRLDHSKKIFSYTNWQSIKDIINGDINYKFSPILTLDLTEKCNYNCKYCIDKKNIDKSKAHEIDWEFLKKLLPEIKKSGCRAIEITGGGEPTLYSHFVDFILLASQIGFRLSLITNGSILNRYRHIISNSNLDWIRISLDAASQETHKKIHSLNTNFFNSIVQSIHDISENISVGISYIVCKYNYKEIYEAAKLAKNNGAIYIEFKPMLNEEKTFENYDYYKSFITSELNKSQNLKDDKFTVIVTQSFKHLLNLENTSIKYNIKDYNKCYSCYIRSVLTPSGLYPCSYFRETEYKVSEFMSVPNIINARNNLINHINPKLDCKNYCARNDLNIVIDRITKFTKEYPPLADIIGWPYDYGDDWLWL